MGSRVRTCTVLENRIDEQTDKVPQVSQRLKSMWVQNNIVKQRVKRKLEPGVVFWRFGR